MHYGIRTRGKKERLKMLAASEMFPELALNGGQRAGKII
jgi:hypothetical protein